jgi:hypothetical protein
MEICVGIDLKRAKLAMDLNLRGQVTETKLVVGVACVRYNLVSERMGIERQSSPVIIEKHGFNFHFKYPVAVLSSRRFKTAKIYFVVKPRLTQTTANPSA